MSRILKRPMFNKGGRAGALDSGIVSGFAKPSYKIGGAVQRQGFRGGNYVDLIDKYMTKPEPTEGMTKADYLRIAAAGAQIMGAPVVSDQGGVMGALANSATALSSLGTDLASSSDARRLAYEQELADYNKLRAGTAIEQRITEDSNEFQRELQEDQQTFTAGEAVLDRSLQLDVIREETDAAIEILEKELELFPNKYKLEKELQEERAQALIKEMKLLPHNSDAYLEKRDILQSIIFGETTRLIASEKSDLMKDADFQKAIRTAVASGVTVSTIPPGESGHDPMFYNKTETEIRDIILMRTFKAAGLIDIYIPEGIKESNAHGGRVGRYAGGMMGDEGVDATGPMEPGPNPDPNQPPIMQAASSQQPTSLTYDELRKRLPPEVSDMVIKLILSSEEAMIDFAQLQTPQDITRFNQKYNTDLELPTVA